MKKIDNKMLLFRIALLVLMLVVAAKTFGQTTTFNYVSNWNKETKMFEEPVSKTNTIVIDRVNKRVRINGTQVFIVQRFLDQSKIFIIDCRDSLTREECSIEFKDKGKVVQFDFLNRRYIFK